MKNEQLMEELEKSMDDKIERTRLMEGFLGYIICSTQEAVVLPPLVAFAVRPHPGIWEYVKVNSEDLAVDGITSSEYSIGNGTQFVARFLSSRLSGNPESMKPLVDYLLTLKHGGERLMINDSLDTMNKLQTALLLAEVFVSGLPKNTPFQKFEQRFQEWGLEKGWGETAGRAKETLNCLSEVLQAPDPSNMEKFFSRLPTIFKLVIFSVHGYFGQADVLGLPDTGGQVVYILDQVKALEEELLLRIKQQGLSVKPQILVVTRLIPEAKGTKCNQELEPILNTQHSHILRVPFKEENGSVVKQWISRFDIYPYLERYAQACD